MPRKLTIDSLKSELNSVEKLFNDAIEADDPIGEMQFNYRQSELSKRIQELEGSEETNASVALFFGGKPVLGSKGIAAEFAGGVLERFQDLITRTFANAELGDLGKRGRIPLKEDTRLMVTELARGSFGFILDEMSEQTEIQDTQLKLMVDEVATIVEKTGSPNEPDFEEILDSIDPRTLISLKEFFLILDNNEATIRLVENDRDFLLDKYAVHRGRLRTEATSIDEMEKYFEGKLIGFLPEHRKFEFILDDGEIIYGSASKDAAKQRELMIASGVDLENTKLQVKVSVRSIKPLNREPKEIYHLVELSPNNEIKF